MIATDGNCSLGAPLTKYVDTFLGISGPNYGLCVCQLAQTIPAWCNALDGLYPGYSCEDQVRTIKIFDFLYNMVHDQVFFWKGKKSEIGQLLNFLVFSYFLLKLVFLKL